jgi:hypothetical protein
MILRNQALLAVDVQPSFSVPEEVVDGITTLSCKFLTFTAVERHNEAITPFERQIGGKPAADDECLLYAFGAGLHPRCSNGSVPDCHSTAPHPWCETVAAPLRKRPPKEASAKAKKNSTMPFDASDQTLPRRPAPSFAPT